MPAPCVAIRVTETAAREPGAKHTSCVDMTVMGTVVRGGADLVRLREKFALSVRPALAGLTRSVPGSTHVDTTQRARVKHLAWASGKERTTKSFQWFLSGWARRSSWRETARQFAATWDTVFRSVKMAVC